jgi:GT2 family glycosyltransferase
MEVTRSARSVRLLEVELSDGIPAVPAVHPDTGTLYHRVLSLVRLHTYPVGLVPIDLGAAGLSGAEHARAIWQAAGQDIAEHLRQDGVPVPATLTDQGCAASAHPRCRRTREEVAGSGPAVSVIICTRDRTEDLADCLATLTHQDYHQYEILVVDNAPATAASEDLIQRRYADEPRVRYLREDRPGLSNARNRGLAEAKGDIIAYTDDDVLLDRSWLTELVRGFSVTQEVACVTGLVLPFALETPAQRWFEEFGGYGKGFRTTLFDLDAHRPKHPLFPYAIALVGTGSNMAFTKQALTALGGFDPALGTGTRALGGEDLAAFFQIMTEGYQLVYTPAALLRHKHRPDYHSLRTQMVGYGAGLTAYATQVLLRDPVRTFRELVPQLPAALRYALDPASPKNARKSDDYPAELTRLELQGMLYGPLAHLRARWDARPMRWGFRKGCH